MSKFKMAAVFSDNCVLQRNKQIAVFGEGADGAKVTVSLLVPGKNLQSVETTVKEGRWLAYLPSQEATYGCSLSAASEGETITFKDIAIGEVWLCGGQSNMEFELQNCSTGKEHLENDKPNVRFYYTPKNPYFDEQFFKDEAASHWKKFSEEDAKDWSAVGYIFGKKLSEKLGVTVGLLGCNWGGTSASCWMSKEALLEDEDTKTYWDDFAALNVGKSEEEQVREYDAYKVREAIWNEKCAAIYTANPQADWGEVQKEIGICEWPGPMNCKNPFRPVGLYEHMLKRVEPYSLRGWLFYQGESDDHKPGYYYKLYKRMLKQWRDDWKDETIPMLYVQLPGMRYANEEDKKHWCLIREAQQKISDEEKYSTMACTIECGTLNDIHPKDKEPIGDRLYRVALSDVYGLMPECEAKSPELLLAEFAEGACIVKLRFADGGLKINGESIEGFELAGEDREFKPAEAAILEDGKSLKVVSAEVKEPKYVRYLWTNYPSKVTLFSAYGLPVAPFRSSEDDQENIMVRKMEFQQQLEL